LELLLVRHIKCDYTLVDTLFRP